MLRIARNKYRRCGQTGGILRSFHSSLLVIFLSRAWNGLEWVTE